MEKQILLLILSSSLPRYNGDYSGSFIPPLQKNFKKNIFIPNIKAEKMKLLYLSPRDILCGEHYKARAFASYLYFPYCLNRKTENLGHGKGKVNLKRFILSPFYWLKLTSYFISALLALKRINKRYGKKYEIVLWSHFAFPSALIAVLFTKSFLLNRIFKAEKIHHLATFHSSGVHLYLKAGFIGKVLLKYIIKKTDCLHIISCYLKKKLPYLPGEKGDTIKNKSQKINLCPIKEKQNATKQQRYFVSYLRPDVPPEISKLKFPLKNSILENPSFINKKKTKLNIEKKNRENSLSLGNLVRATSFQNFLSSEKIRIVYAGSFYPVKGILSFVKNLNDTEEDSRDFILLKKKISLYILGQGPDEKELTEQIKKLKKKSFYVEFISGRLAKKDMFLFLSFFDYVLFPSIDTKGFSEGIPVSALEALSLHIPILASNTGGLSELFWNFSPGYILPKKNLVPFLNVLPDPASGDYLYLQKQCQNLQKGPPGC